MIFLTIHDGLVLAIVFTVIAGVATLARFASRWMLRQAPLGPDWLCLLSTVLLFVQLAFGINYFQNFASFANIANIDNLAPGPGQLITMTTWIEEFLFAGAITSIKLSILWFYYTLFHVNKNLRWAIIVTAIACVIWLIITIILLLLQCKRFWLNVSTLHYCYKIPKILLGFEITNLTIDVIILCIPIKAIASLQLPRSKKIAISGVFLVGILTCAASLVRIVAIRLYTYYYEYNAILLPAVVVAGIVQSGLATTVCCLPTLRPIQLAICALLTRPWQAYQKQKFPQASPTATPYTANINLGAASSQTMLNEGVQPWIPRRDDDAFTSN
ncbi:hypothetical protein F4861DRAFT_496279 [Xylaria intraflava]|nr:hypothetical protein F4861DRAFT_496279 [Xylaria intraflava]